MNGEYVLNLVVLTADSMEEQWNQVTTQMALYLDSPATRSILLKPVSRKIGRLVEEARQIVSQAEEGENGWDATIRANVLQRLGDMEKAVKKVSSAKTAAAASSSAAASTTATTTAAVRAPAPAAASGEAK